VGFNKRVWSLEQGVEFNKRGWGLTKGVRFRTRGGAQNRGRSYTDLLRRPADSVLQPLGGEPDFDLLLAELGLRRQAEDLRQRRVREPEGHTSAVWLSRIPKIMLFPRVLEHIVSEEGAILKKKVFYESPLKSIFT